jgi:hypothetical protein
MTVRTGKDAKSEDTSPGTTAVQVQFDDTGVTNCYANVCNVSSSREEVVLVFGINEDWERRGGLVKVKLTNRIILSPFAAKRLSLLLQNVIQQYESRFGVMDVGTARAETRSTS